MRTFEDIAYWTLHVLNLSIKLTCQIYGALHLKQAESDNTDKDEPAEEEGKTDDVQLFADEGFDAEFRVSTWEQTILGKLSF